ncbi:MULTISPECIES: NAD(P)-dependent oxidoreductase [unclassified Synechococcus]|uniref:NAD(P)-dependent oxidoreductase n=1 Tax=unclassified Synechococcus TaxID=2626047 RepID=UPI0021A37293|nr:MULTISPECIES: NAD(P)-dependent oxidoreductase [unclassified Synechococcus]MCT0212683.1 NAD(P)-dependent oxidoreductase [Synechococcus sp. CS-1326]MCT0233691.1 NAD(P)-dependent oxidoreductase [Synechococcus sp. CS-1327]
MTRSSRPAVSFIGLGALGAPIAMNLLAAGFPLTVHNRSRQREQPLVAAGATAVASPAEAGAAAEWLCLCVSDGPDVEAVLFGAGTASASAGLRPGSVVIDFSTIDPGISRSLARRLEHQGVAYLDAPVTGGTEGARAGTLSVLVGGGATDLERVRPLLEVVGGCITHLGPVGAGQQAKAVNQVLVAGSYAAVAEAMALGQRLGLPMAAVRRALASGAAGSWALEHRAEAMLAGSFPLGFKLALHRKDLAIALAAAAAEGLALPITAQVAAIEDSLIAAGHGGEDVAALARWFRG